MAGPGACVVEVDEMRALVGPQHVAGVAVAVKSQHRHVAGAFECAMHASSACALTPA